MSRQVPPECCWCARPVDRTGDKVFVLTVSERFGAATSLRWHWNPGDCFELDPLHHEMAAAFEVGDPQERAAAVARSLAAIRERAAERGEAHLRAAVDVKRDTATPGLTLRAPGLNWGRLTERSRVG